MSGLDPKFVSTHPELHHYTTFDGLVGITQNNSLWATHFSQLNDTSELNVLKQPLIDVLKQRFFITLRAKQSKSVRLRLAIRASGGLDKTAADVAGALVNTLHEVTFEGGGEIDFGEPFISSFCSHYADQEYERSNGLLSQWRAYGGQGGYCIVFDAAAIGDLLVREAEEFYYAHVDLDAVHYARDGVPLSETFPMLLQHCEQILEDVTDRVEIKAGAAFGPFVSGAALLKHQGFLEEREVRIVALRGSKALLDAEVREGGKAKPIKPIHTNNATKKRYIKLFETLGTKLPINRIIVGPSRDQSGNYERARAILGNRPTIVLSQTPFIG